MHHLLCLESCHKYMQNKDPTFTMLLILFFLQEGTQLEEGHVHGMDGKLHHMLFVVVTACGLEYA